MTNLRYRFLPSFDRSIKRMDHQRKHNVKQAAIDIIKALNNSMKPEGLGIKKLSANLWEIRSGLKDRILYEYANNVIVFIIAGNHDEIRKFMKHNT